MRIRRAAAIVGLSLISVLFPSPVALACTCAGPPSDVEALDDYDAVFAGVAVDHEDPEGDQPIISSGRPIVWTFAVDAVAKGEVSAEQEIISAASGVSCGYPFREGKRYLVFAYPGTDSKRVNDPDADLHTGLCTNTHKLELGEDLPFPSEPMASGDTPFDDIDSDGGIPWVLASIVVVSLIAAGVVWTFRRS